MAKNSVRDYSATNSDNTDIQSIDISEGCAASGINNAIREVMVDLKNVSTGAVALESPAFDSASLTGDLTFGDNDKAIFGAGSDLQIYSDGTTSKIEETGSGSLIIKGTQMILQSASGENLAYFTSNGAATLYHNDVAKIATTSTGVDVTGTAKSDIVQLDAGSAPSWDTNTRLWSESGFGARYDGYQHRFDVGVSRTEAMRITASGSVGIGTGSPASALDVVKNSTTLRLHRTGGTSGYFELASFRNNAGDGAVGSIVRVNDASVQYNTSSDYRLKTSVVYDWDATTRLKQLKPARFEWISDGEDAVPVDGFIAHEVQGVVPEAISGTHNEVEVWQDGEELPDGVSVGDNKLDDDGNTIPVYQGIDQSKLVPLLVKTIQELEARITALEAV